MLTLPYSIDSRGMKLEGKASLIKGFEVSCFCWTWTSSYPRQSNKKILVSVSLPLAKKLFSATPILSRCFSGSYFRTQGKASLSFSLSSPLYPSCVSFTSSLLVGSHGSRMVVGIFPTKERSFFFLQNKREKAVVNACSLRV